MQPSYFDSRREFVQYYMNEAFYRVICRTQKDLSAITVVCIGSDRLIGDSYGPLTGHMLSTACPKITVHGTLKSPVHALTLPKTLREICACESLVIAIDSSVGDEESIGYVGISPGAVRPGSGLGKQLPPVGDISVTGIVAGDSAPFLGLQNASLGLVYGMAEKTAAALRYALTRCQRENARPAAVVRG